ncbi:MAG: hypothetical protein KBT39_04700 [Bacteroidales bacterium]|nr:hypothetical protein [Bacteroidales bacterium]
MNRAKRILYTLSMAAIPAFSSAQTVQLPTMGVFDTSMMREYIENLRYINNHLNSIRPAIQLCREKVTPHFKNGNWNVCRSIFRDFFNCVTVYDSEIPAILDLVYMNGVCKIETGEDASGLRNLKIAKNHGSSEANRFLEQYFEKKVASAESHFQNREYDTALSEIEWAFNSNYHSGYAYYLQGEILEALSLFKEAKKAYKKAKKLQSPYAEKALKELKNKLKRKEGI